MHSSMTWRRGLPVIAGALLALAAPSAFADSTTGTTLTVEGKPIPAKQVVMHVVLTGSHIVFLGQGTVSGGTVDLYVDGQVIAHQQIDGHNSNVTKEDPCTVVAPNGQCQADLYYGDHTEIRYAVTLPNKVGQHVFGAQFTGDKKSHSSSATDVTVKAVYPNIAPVTSVLLD